MTEADHHDCHWPPAALTTATINRVAAAVIYAGPVPAELAGAGNVNIQLTAEAQAAIQ